MSKNTRAEYTKQELEKYNKILELLEEAKFVNELAGHPIAFTTAEEKHRKQYKGWKGTM